MHGLAKKSGNALSYALWLNAILLECAPQFFEHFTDVACDEANKVNLPLIEIPWEIPFAQITEELHRTIIAEQYYVIEQSEAIHHILTSAALEANSLQDLAMMEEMVSVQNHADSFVTAFYRYFVDVGNRP